MLNNMLMHVPVRMLAMRSEDMEQENAVIVKTNYSYTNNIVESGR